MAEPAPTTPDPIEIAMEAEAGDRSADSPARRVLLKHEKLIEADLKHRRWQIASERAGFAVKVLTSLAGVAAAAALGMMAWEASRANGVVVEPFTVPPELAQRGLSGQAVSSQVLDELATLYARTESGRVNDGAFQASGDNSVKVAIPATGVSLGDLQAALRKWLGHEMHISGEVYRTPGGGLAIRARITGREGVRVEGPEADLEALTRAAAHEVFRQTKPARYAGWLGNHGDVEGAMRLLRQVAEGDGPVVERAAAYHSWGYYLQQTDVPGAIAVTREALALTPDAGNTWAQLAVYENSLGRLEAAVAARRRGAELQERHPDRGLRPEARDPSFLRVIEDVAIADFPAALVGLHKVDANRFNARRYGVQVDGLAVAIHGNLHDIGAARARLASPRAVNPDLGRQDERLRNARLTLAQLSEDWAELLKLDAEAEAARPAGSPPAVPTAPRRYDLALAHAKLGEAEAARALLPQPPADCTRCLFQAGRVHAALGDAAAAERVFAAAARLMPTLPHAHFWWGETRLARGDAAGALPLLREAGKRQPRWADPFKLEGDALARLGRFAEADATYAKAAALAPKWGGLHLRRGQALARLGKTEAARAELGEASGLFLTPAERTGLAATSLAH